MTDETLNQEATTEETKVEVPAHIRANFDNTVDFKEFSFFFKKDKELGVRRPTVTLKLPVPSVEGVIKILETGGKQLDLLLDAVQDIVLGQARSIINEREDINAENFPYDKVTWDYVANLPKAERRGGGISKETWEAFAEDYIAVMPGITGKTLEQVQNAAKILLNKFNVVKTSKPHLRLLKEQLALYAQHSPNAEQYGECVEFLVDKAERLLNMDEATLLQNL